MKRRAIISDIILNIFASIMPIFILQFLLLPFVASKLDADSYGQVLTIIGLMNLSAASLGSILNNSRLINYKKYEEQKVEGDFNILLIVLFLINVCIMAFGLWFYEETYNEVNIFLIMIASCFLLLKGYGVVEFRTKLNYKYILVDSIFLLIGYGVGFLLFLLSGYWQFIFFCGFASSFIFVFIKTKIFRESYRRTALFKKTISQTLSLLIAGLFLGIATYVDRLLLYPLLGGAAVSIYYTATIIGKTVSLVIQPIAGVFLSYLAQLQKLDKKFFYILLATSFVVGIIGYWATILISKPVLTLLYPQYVDGALKYIYITTLTIIITIISSMINPLVLRFCDTKWQVFIDGTYLVLYITFSVILLDLYGLMGFIVGTLIASIIKLLIILMIYFFFNIKAQILIEQERTPQS
jgi:O-antigen/teichoic acid export membrane protein